jgi:hypothetical protein
MSIPVRFEDSTDIIGWAIHCEQSDEDTAADIADFADSIMRGDREVEDEDGEVIDHTTITEEQALEFARIDIEEGDWGRDGWTVTWVNTEDGEVQYRGGDRDEAMTLFATKEEAVALAERLALDGSTETMEVWAIVN